MNLIDFFYLKTSANAKVTEGTMLLNANEKVEDVYSSPIRKKYCTKLVLYKFVSDQDQYKHLET